MKKSDINDIDLIFLNHFAESEVLVTNRQDLWNRIRGSRRRYRIIPFLFIGFLISFISYSAYWNEFRNEEFVQVDYFTETFKSVNSTHPHLMMISSEVTPPLEFENKYVKIKDVATEYISSNDSKSISSNDHLWAERDRRDQSFINFQSDENNGISEILISKKQIDPIQLSSETYSDILKKDEQITNDDANLSSKIDNERAPVYGKNYNDKTLENLPLTEYDLLDISLDATSFKNSLSKCTTTRGGRFFMDVYTMVGVAVESIILNDAFADQTAYRVAWEERYNTLPSLSAGISVGYEMSSGLGISVGAEYQRIESEYQTIQTITERVTVYDPMAYFYYDINNEVVWVGDSVTAISSYDRTVSLGNSFNMIHVPLEVSYSLYKKDALTIRASVSAVFNFSLDYEGQYLRPDQSLIQIDKSNNATYVAKNLGFGFEGGAYFGYQLSDQWEIYAGPKFRYNNNSYWKDGEAINTSRHFITFRTGLRYLF